MTLNLVWLDDFLALARTGNFSRAAAERHVTQPAFSRRIRALETWLGVDLFDRSAQPARLTEAGLWFREAARELQAQAGRLPGEAKAVAEASADSLTLAATHALSSSFVPRWLGGLQGRNGSGWIGPVRLVSDVQQKCENLLLHHQVHFLVAHAHPMVRGPLEDAGCPSALIGQDRLLLVSAPDDDGRPVHGPSRRGEPALANLNYSAESGLGRIVAAHEGRGALAAGSAGARPAARDGKGARGGAGDGTGTGTGPGARTTTRGPAVTADLASVLRSMALNRNGLAWLPGLLVDDDIAMRRLVMASFSEDTIDVEIRLYRRDRNGLGRAAEALWRAASRRKARPAS